MDEFQGVYFPRRLRKIILTGNTMEPKKEGSVLNHVCKFIALEKRTSLKDLKKEDSGKDNSIKSKEDLDATQCKNELESNNAKFVALKSVSTLEKASVRIFEMINENKGNEVLTTLVSVMQQSSFPVCKEIVILILVLLIKTTNDVKLISECYSQVRTICRNTKLLMLFIELCKIYSVAQDKSSGWGRGMKKAVRNWYLTWKPEDLALEVTRNPSAYTWSHKDVLKMAHINLKPLPTGTQVVLTYIFSGYENSKKKFGEDETAADILHYLDVLHGKAKEMDNPNIVIERGKNILNEFKSLTMNDIPSHLLTDKKVLSFILEKGNPVMVIDALTNTSVTKSVINDDGLANVINNRLEEENFIKEVDVLKLIFALSSCIRAPVLPFAFLKMNVSHNPVKKEKIGHNNPDPSTMKEKTVQIKLPRSKAVEALFRNMNHLITERAKNMKKTETPTLIFVDVTTGMEKFIPIGTENTFTKAVKGIQAISFLIISLAPTDDVESALPLLFDKMKSVETNCTDTNKELIIRLSTAIKKPIPLNIEVSIDLAVKKRAASLLIYYSATEDALDRILKLVKKLKEDDESAFVRVVVLFLERETEMDVEPFLHPNIIHLFGFNQYTLTTIQSFVDNHL